MVRVRPVLFSAEKPSTKISMFISSRQKLVQSAAKEIKACQAFAAKLKVIEETKLIASTINEAL